MDTIEWVILIAGAVFGLALSFKLFFRHPGDFLEAIKFWFTPDIFSLFRGQWAQDQWNEMKLIIWFVVGGAFGMVALEIFQKLSGR